RLGAPDPRAVTPAPPPPLETKTAIDYAAARKQWAFHRPERPLIPQVQEKDWPRAPLDRFILAKLEERNLHPAPQASKRALIRRATFDLIGLPPTAEETEAFLADLEPDAFSKVIERLLASPHYGECWGRHWLDVVRYADSLDARSVGKDGDIVDAWRYRDWVVSAFNRDLPYDEFVTEQIAGDILAARQWDPGSVAATGMYAIGNWGNGVADKEKHS